VIARPPRNPRDYPFEPAPESTLLLPESEVPLAAAGAAPLRQWTVSAPAGGRTKLGELLDADFDQALSATRWPLIAYGSNANVGELRDKLSAAPKPLFLPMLRATLRGFDVVYSAHVSPRGAIPATLHPCDGTEATVFVLLLDQAQLRLVDERERNYRRQPLGDPAALRVEGDFRSAGAYAYLSKHGALDCGGEPCAVAAAAPTSGRSFGEMTESEVLAEAARRLGVDESPDEFIASSLDPAAAAERTAVLKRGAHESTL
jgi:hypothetical protein